MSEQKWPDKIILIRHGQSARNVMKDEAELEGGREIWAEGVRDQDSPLTDVGVSQAIAVGVHLAKTEPALQTIFASPYLRTRQTAEQIVHGFGDRDLSANGTLKLVTEERIREMEFGIVEGLTSNGFKVKYPEEFARREIVGKYWFRPLGVESRPDVALRIHSFLGTLTRDYQKTVAVVAHSVVILCFRRLLERWGEEEYLQVDREDDVKNCSVTTYACCANRMVLEEYNQRVNSEAT
jgi:broad specificity phosphatase PhoE